MTQIQAYSIMFFTGGFLYCCIEIIARGYSHFSMLLAGGTCFLLVGLIEYLLGDSASLLSQMILCGLPRAVGLHHRFCIVVLPHQPAEKRRVCGGIRLIQADGKLFKAVADSIHLGKHVRHNSGSSPYKLRFMFVQPNGSGAFPPRMRAAPGARPARVLPPF